MLQVDVGVFVSCVRMPSVVRVWPGARLPPSSTSKISSKDESHLVSVLHAIQKRPLSEEASTQDL